MPTREIAIHHAWLVVGVVAGATTAGELDDVRAQLSAEFEQLFVPPSQQ